MLSNYSLKRSFPVEIESRKKILLLCLFSAAVSLTTYYELIITNYILYNLNKAYWRNLKRKYLFEFEFFVQEI